MGNIFASLVLLVLGGFMAVFTKTMVRFQTWSQHRLMGAQYIPSQRTYKMVRAVGMLLIIIGVLVLGIWKFMGTNQPVTLNGAGPGERCGGNMMNAPICATGYHCAPEAGTHLPFGDVGGTCVAN